MFINSKSPIDNQGYINGFTALDYLPEFRIVAAKRALAALWLSPGISIMFPSGSSSLFPRRLFFQHIFQPFRNPIFPLTYPGVFTFQSFKSSGYIHISGIDRVQHLRYLLYSEYGFLLPIELAARGLAPQNR